MLLRFSRVFKDIITKSAKFKEFPGLENKFQNSRGFKEIKDTWEPWYVQQNESFVSSTQLAFFAKFPTNVTELCYRRYLGFS